ncbi:flagellar motor switch protein FliN/FliY [Salsuginibacillus halophilus]|uniref:Flagellar motor switch protein FliN/FliY n=1 Tax=Salsuginibacillus halophilus TaxID=517424 RepID=A0A2P8HYA5_9BACI|nr:flagellar motor switch phosphatase FliY [Salsuginibacillus halophilus]PSL51200.1 flagellar motor switch protein FliN/FliY [Salsuginibacillus halophilus]
MNDNDNMLSQDEINELLKGIDNDDDNDANNNEEAGNEEAGGDETNEGYPPPASDAELNVSDYLSEIEQDALGEIGNISFGSAATALSQLLNHKTEITTPVVSAVRSDLIAEEFPQPRVSVHVQYTEGFEGSNVLVIQKRDAAIIADLMLGGDGTNPAEDLTEMHTSAVEEAMNQMMGSASTSMSTVFNKKVDISPPGIGEVDPSDEATMQTLPEENILIKISFRLQIGDLVDSALMQFVTVGFAKQLVEDLMNPGGGEEAAATAEPAQEPQPQQAPPQPEPQPQQQQAPPQPEPQPQQQQQPQQPAAGYSQPQYQQPPPQPQQLGVDQRAADVQPAAFASFDPPELNQSETKNLNMLMDIPLEVSVELGRTKRSIRDILEFTQGSIIELDKLAGEPVDILVNQKLIAKGEVVVIDENFGVRVTDIISPEDRLKNLNK